MAFRRTVFVERNYPNMLLWAHAGLLWTVRKNVPMLRHLYLPPDTVTMSPVTKVSGHFPWADSVAWPACDRLFLRQYYGDHAADALLSARVCYAEMCCAVLCRAVPCCDGGSTTRTTPRTFCCLHWCAPFSQSIAEHHETYTRLQIMLERASLIQHDHTIPKHMAVSDRTITASQSIRP
jgi:hypothetical protein